MKKFELWSVREIAYLASSSRSGIIQHFKDKTGNHVYFLVGGTMKEIFVYYVRGEEINNKFINIDTSKDKIEYSDLPIINPRTKVISIIEIKKQDLLNYG